MAEFTEIVLHGGAETGEMLAQVDVQFGSAIDCANVGQAFDGREHLQVLDVAPTRAEPLHVGDALMVLGTSEAIESFSAAAAQRDES